MADKIKTLSDAILLGSTFRPQSFDDFYDHGHTCALGAAAEAIGIDVTDGSLDITKLLATRFPAIETKDTIGCPDKNCRDEHSTFCDTVVHLNDGHHWKRERIAAYLKTKGL